MKIPLIKRTSETPSAPNQTALTVATGRSFVPDAEYKRQNDLPEDDNRPRYPLVLAKNDDVLRGPSLDLSKLVLTRFRKNPIFQWAHPSSYWDPLEYLIPLGNIEAVRWVSAEHELQGNAVFIPDDEFVDRVHNAWKWRALRAVSIGWAPGAREGDPPILLEVSAVPIGADEDALRRIQERAYGGWIDLIGRVPENSSREGVDNPPRVNEDEHMPLSEDDLKQIDARRTAAEAATAAVTAGIEKFAEEQRKIAEDEKKEREAARQRALEVKQRTQLIVLAREHKMLPEGVDPYNMSIREILLAALGTRAQGIAHETDGFLRATFIGLVNERKAAAGDQSVTGKPGTGTGDGNGGDGNRGVPSYGDIEIDTFETGVVMQGKDNEERSVDTSMQDSERDAWVEAEADTYFEFAGRDDGGEFVTVEEAPDASLLRGQAVAV